MWQLEVKRNDKGEVIETNHRIYTNAVTGSKCEQTMVKQDRDGNKWWEFSDLALIPWTRKMAAIQIESLYALGLSKDDLSEHINGLKVLLKSTDTDKYEKAYANVLAFESKAASATDAIKQISAMCAVYYTLNDELIDSFENNLQLRKMQMLSVDPELHNFFLKRRIEAIERWAIISKAISQTVFPTEQQNGEALV